MQPTLVDFDTDPSDLRCPAGRLLFLLIRQIAGDQAALLAEPGRLPERKSRLAALLAQVRRIEELFGDVRPIEAGPPTPG
jgi:hypothetical protein